MLWKREFGEVHLTSINGIEFIFRLITFREYETLNHLFENEIDLDEQICSLCVLSPELESWGGEVFGGYTSSLAAMVKEESLISPKQSGETIQDIIEKGSNQMASNFQLQLPAIIARVFPQYKIQELEDMSLKEQVDLYIKASWVLSEIDNVQLGFDEE